METQATITIACRSGQVYEATLGDDNTLPFGFFTRRFQLIGVEQKDQTAVRLGLCVSQFVLVAERFYRDEIEADPGMTKCRVTQPKGLRIVKVDEFANEVAFHLSHWGDLMDMVLDSRSEVAKRGYVSDAAFQALGERYHAHIDSIRRATGAPYVVIDRINIPDADLYAYANFDFDFCTVRPIPELLADRVVAYAILRHKGVPMETLVTAFEQAVDELVRSGGLRNKTH